MEPISDVIVVSCFGRGHWLASAWANRGLAVTLIDLSETVGHWAPEDWEGPFGVFRTETLQPLQQARLMDDAYLVEVENGFTLWTEKGVLELKGPLTQYRLAQLGLSDATLNYLNQFDAAVGDKRRDFYVQVRGEGFEQSWLALLAHQLASNVYLENSMALSWGRPLPLFAPWMLRRATRRGYEDALKAYRHSGVRMLPQAQVLDIDVVGNEVHGLEVRSEWSGIVRGRNLVWLLSSEESQRVHEKVHRVLFPKGAVLPEWSWMRYRVEVEQSTVSDMLPVAFVLLNNKHLPWAHANTMVVQRTDKATAFDVWVRLPVHQRFQRQYLESVAEEIVSVLGLRLPATKVSILEMPQEYRYDYGKVGAPRFPVYARPPAPLVTTFAGGNTHFAGPEYWQSLDWLGQMRVQAPIEETVTNWWQKEKQRQLDLHRGSELRD